MSEYYDRKTPRDHKERIRSKVSIDENGCWVWNGKYFNKWGYARMITGSRRDGTRSIQYVHRVSYEAFVGKIPIGLSIDHLCKNTKCLNPSHLEPVTTKENNRRKRKDECGICGEKKIEKWDRLVCLPCQKIRIRNYMRKIRSSKTKRVDF
jgi:hypothetical protein